MSEIFLDDIPRLRDQSSPTRAAQRRAAKSLAIAADSAQHQPPPIALPVIKLDGALLPAVAEETATWDQDKYRYTDSPAEAQEHDAAHRSALSRDNGRLVFGNKGDYWAKYHDAAKKSDEAMLKRLGGDLDILLIFAGLFSAVDTAFIAVTLPMLNASPNDETNFLLRTVALRGSNAIYTADDLTPPPFTPPLSAVRANAYFISSLSLSILASFGAVLGKQWLSHAEKPRLGGSSQAQGQQRQMMYTGMERWHLQGTIDALPVVLQLALLSFWLGLFTLLTPYSRAVSYVATAFAVAGAIFYFVTSLGAILDPSCPFQTPVVIMLRRTLPLLILLPVLGVWLTFMLPSLFAAYVSFAMIVVLGSPFLLLLWLLNVQLAGASGWKAILWWGWRVIGRFTRFVGRALGAITWMAPSLKRDEVSEAVNANSVKWLLKSSVDDDLLLRTAMNIPALGDVRSIVHLCFPTASFFRLMTQFTSHIVQLQQDSRSMADMEAETTTEADTTTEVGVDIQNPAPHQAAVYYARSLIHVSLAAPCVHPNPNPIYAVHNPTVIEYVSALQEFEPPPASVFNELRLFNYTVTDGVRSVGGTLDVEGINGSVLPMYMAALMGQPYQFLNTSELEQGSLTKYAYEVMEKFWVGGERARKEENETQRQQHRLPVVATLALATLGSQSGAQPSVLNLVSWAFSVLLNPAVVDASAHAKSWHLRRWEAYTSDKNLFSNLSKALKALARIEASSRVARNAQSTLPPQHRRKVDQVYVELLKGFREMLRSEGEQTYNEKLVTAWSSLEPSINQLRNWGESLSELEQRTAVLESFESLRHAAHVPLPQRSMDPFRKFQRALTHFADRAKDAPGDLIETIGEQPWVRNLKRHWTHDGP